MRKEAAPVALPQIAGLSLSPELMPSKALQTPFMRQWFAAKERYPEALIFFRMGDFYELFLDDAVKASQLLGLTLTSRNKGEADEIPMAGAPHHNAHTYVARALKHGLNVAICEQMADPAKCKGIVPREVVRVITPGLVVDEHALDARSNHWLVAVENAGEEGAAMAALDYTTGELLACAVTDGASALAEVARMEPAEVLLGPSAHDLFEAISLTAPRAAVRKEPALIEDAAALRTLSEHLGASEAAVAAHDAPKLARRAAARALAYAQGCTPAAKVEVQRLSLYAPGDTLQSDDSTAGHLELGRAPDGEVSHTLLSQVDATRTPAGAPLLPRWNLGPPRDLGSIRSLGDNAGVVLPDPAPRGPFRGRFSRTGDP